MCVACGCGGGRCVPGAPSLAGGFAIVALEGSWLVLPIMLTLSHCSKRRMPKALFTLGIFEVRQNTRGVHVYGVPIYGAPSFGRVSEPHGGLDAVGNGTVAGNALVAVVGVPPSPLPRPGAPPFLASTEVVLGCSW